MNEGVVQVQEADQIPGVAVVTIAGPFDVGSPAIVEFTEAVNRLLEMPISDVVLDTTAMTELDSRGIGALVFASRKLNNSGLRSRLVAPSEETRRAMGAIGALALFEVHQTAEEAFGAIAEQRQGGPSEG